jgi:hypothetical protein
MDGNPFIFTLTLTLSLKGEGKLDLAKQLCCLVSWLEAALTAHKIRK